MVVDEEEEEAEGEQPELVRTEGEWKACNGSWSHSVVKTSVLLLSST